MASIPGGARVRPAREDVAARSEAAVAALRARPGQAPLEMARAAGDGRPRTVAAERLALPRRGHGDGNWLPTLVSVDGSERRALDLFDHDEWRWALLARSRAVGVEEFVERTGVEVHVTWPLPAQLRAAMDIVGVPTGAWRWRVAADAPALWSLLK